MKLPEYDNRTAAGEPLYSSSSAKGEWEDIKFPLLAIGIPAAMLIALGVTAYALVQLFA